VQRRYRPCRGDPHHLDPRLIGLADLLDVFFATHDPTQLNRQGNDIGTQYRSALFPLDEAQRAEAVAAIARAQADHAQPIVTTIEDLAPWYPAEDYHQDYWPGEGQRNPYCLAVIPPKLAKLRKGFAQRLKG
jgi:peptide-methionine (S)-S-oxide reductase